MSPTQLRILRAAAKRPGGYVCPTSGLHGAIQEKVLKALEGAGYITKEPAPRITETGRTIAAED